MNAHLDWRTISDAELTQLARDFSAGQIADMVSGATRNAVIGRCYRRGISLASPSPQRRYAPPAVEQLVELVQQRREDERARVSRARKAKAALRAKPEPVAEPELVFEALAATDPVGVLFMDLHEGDCRYPLWKGDVPFSEKRYCGVEVTPGRSYCHHCYGIIYSARLTQFVDKTLGMKSLARRVA